MARRKRLRGWFWCEDLFPYDACEEVFFAKDFTAHFPEILNLVIINANPSSTLHQPKTTSFRRKSFAVNHSFLKRSVV